MVTGAEWESQVENRILQNHSAWVPCLHTCIDEGIGAQHHIAQLRVAQHAALAYQRVVELTVADDGWGAERACMRWYQELQVAHISTCICSRGEGYMCADC